MANKAGGQAVTVPSGTDIASDALKYQGLGYVWGGNASRPGDWDCSAFVSYVLGHDFGLTLPGGGTYGSSGYPPNSHGPVVSDYAAWSGATTLGKGEAAQAGDLVMWLPDTHIGIVIGPGQMISALDTQLGTVASAIGGAASGTIAYRRVNGAGTAPSGAGGTSATTSVGSSLAGILAAAGIGVGVAGGLVVLVVGGAAVAGVIGAALLAAAIARARGG